MDLKELQQVWIHTTGESIFQVDQALLYKSIQQKNKAARHVANVTELITIFVNLLAGAYAFFVNFSGKENPWIYLMSAWMLGTATYGLYHRSRRQAEQPNATINVRDHMEQALYTIRKQVKLSQLMRLNIFPVAILTTISSFNAGKPFLFLLAILSFFVLCYYFSGWEHRLYIRKKKELESLKSSLGS